MAYLLSYSVVRERYPFSGIDSLLPGDTNPFGVNLRVAGHGPGSWGRFFLGFELRLMQIKARKDTYGIDAMGHNHCH